jgi:hypothetical protein
MSDEKHNPYYHPEKLGIKEVLIIDENDQGYEFNTLCFFVHEDGRIFSAQDSGCSCPTPFEDFEGAMIEDCKLTLVTSYAQALRIYTEWFEDVKKYHGSADKSESDLRKFFESNTK